MDTPGDLAAILQVKSTCALRKVFAPRNCNDCPLKNALNKKGSN